MAELENFEMGGGDEIQNDNKDGQIKYVPTDEGDGIVKPKTKRQEAFDRNTTGTGEGGD